MEVFFASSYFISLLVGALTFTVIIYVAKYHYQIIQKLPKALRLFLIICYFPFVIVNALFTFSIALISLINGTQYNLIIDILTITSSFATQNIRNFFFTIILERIVATILLEKYKLSHKNILSIILTLWSQGISFCYVTLLLYSRFIASIVSSEVLTCSIFSIYAVTIIVCALLYYLNLKMYKVTAYKITLKKRHQIVENVKVLSFAFPSILIYTVLAPLGAIITITAFSLKFSPLPYSIGHIFSNLPHLIICIRLIFVNRKSAKHDSVKVVKNALGKNLPVVMTNDKYFKDLKEQWN